MLWMRYQWKQKSRAKCNPYPSPHKTIQNSIPFISQRQPDNVTFKVLKCVPISGVDWKNKSPDRCYSTLMAPFQELKQLANDHNIKAMVIPAQNSWSKAPPFQNSMPHLSKCSWNGVRNNQVILLGGVRIKQFCPFKERPSQNAYKLPFYNLKFQRGKQQF